MALTLRLVRLGKKNSPTYRVVAIDKRKKRNGTYVEIIGTYDPKIKDSNLIIDKAKLDSWLSKGATLSDGLAKLLKNRKKN